MMMMRMMMKMTIMIMKSEMQPFIPKTHLFHLQAIFFCEPRVDFWFGERQEERERVQR